MHELRRTPAVSPRRHVIFKVFFYIFPLVSSLECNSCASSTTWDDCKTSEITCPPTDDQQCIKVYFKYGEHEMFSKGCAPKALCESSKNPICQEATGSDFTCDISCCNDKDNCNAGSAFHISDFLLLACALASLQFLVKF